MGDLGTILLFSNRFMKRLKMPSSDEAENALSILCL